MHSMLIFYSVLVLYVSRWVESGAPGAIVTQLREDRNLDLSEDAEYEDLRAELLAYHTAFASLAAAQRTDVIGPDEEQPPQGRRSLGSTPCWELGGICIDKELCPKGNRFMTEVHGCRDKLRVCCFTWNQFKLKDMSKIGIKNWAYPWSVHHDFGGDGFNVPEGGEPEKGKDSENDAERPDEESGEYKPNDIDKPNSQEKRPTDNDNEEEDEKPERRRRRQKNKRKRHH